MKHDDDTLADIDLTAWEVPPPPAGLADAVLQRMSGTQVNVALPVETEPPQRRWWLVAGVAAAAALVVVVGAVVWALAGDARPEAPATGTIVAEHARVLTLGTARASLDPGADVRWRRESGRLYVEQRAGAATWHVERGEQLVIAAGAGVASVEATGANLRVEVQMNATDVRVIGASAVTAAAVSLVTVIVYEGHVKAGRGEQATVVVAPGTTYRIENEEARPVVGGSVATVPREEPNEEDEDKQEAAGNAKKQDEVDEELIDLGPPPASTVPSALDRPAIQEAMTKLRPSLSACNVHGGGRVIAKMRVAPNGKVVRVTATSDNAELAACVEPIVATARFPMTERGGAFDYPLVYPTATTCDAQALKERGMEHIQVGEHAVALTLFEASLECKPDLYVIQLAFMSACSSGNSAKAKAYYKQLSPQQQQRLRQICVRQKVELE